MIDDARTKVVVVSFGSNVAGIHATRAQENRAEWVRVIANARMFLYRLIKQQFFLFCFFLWERMRPAQRERKWKESKKCGRMRRRTEGSIVYIKPKKRDILGIER